MILGVAVSGNLGFIVLKELIQLYEIKFVITDSNSDKIIQFCKANTIKLYAGNPRNGKALNKLGDSTCDVLVSVNYLFLIENDLINLPSQIAINFHGSLLPKYRGRTPHVWAIINGETQTGITAHQIDGGCDTGAIIGQKIVKIEPNDTGVTVLGKYNETYPSFVVEILESINNKTYSLTEQDNSKATFFGKRTPEDGCINWNWHKERIMNWIRALASPYPGAFTHYEGRKVIINNAECSDFGFRYDDENGKIILLIDNDIIVKTPNGCLKLSNLKSDEVINYRDNTIFS